MSKSLDFCRVVGSDPDISDLAQKDWTHAGEIPSEQIFDRRLNGERAVLISNKDSISEPSHCGVRLIFDPDANFEYFTSAASIFENPFDNANEQPEVWENAFSENIDELVERILCGLTYDIRVGRPEIGNILCYTIGNFVALGEYCEDSNMFETTVLLPLKFRILPEGML